ncbi:tRNA 4-demethylwyosine(37)-methyltransferase Taw21 [Sulfurisphaera ohwakuensis]|uniref:Class I SAM-dependent methyltransferase family protein n=1 Tax=Sulfurisphaera ohwakuensis TaxID=69656 RepID=A0A650CEE3_SULOH|nr:class I SAM-dependent methyltransferase family protein [Sulfurisphaera ohwakuensis]MBB5252841.1 tRNA (guanine37-N1)-methyltransferase [Sulfurisphaera ohwakuensis]QGR16223.1 class I SAM-dependent methyltransferase family protein [Sulfurisphaera ohwakuensis]
MIKDLVKELGLWKRVEIIGDIAVIGIPFDKTPEDVKPFAEELLRKLTYIKAVWGRYRDTHGDYRLSTLVHLAGEKRSETIYKEHGCRYFLDITKVFFSAKLSYEHLRIAKEVKSGEIIINMFAGYGPFSILSYILGKPKIVYSIDINPFAYYYMMVNIDLNKAYGVIPIYGNAFEKINYLPTADRIISPLPEKAEEAFKVAWDHVKSGGIVHLFTEVEGEDPLNKIKDMYPNVIFARIVRSVKPKVYHVVVDIRK